MRGTLTSPILPDSTMTKPRLIPIYTTAGDVGAFLVYPYLYNRVGEWIGWVRRDREVYSVYGRYVGHLGNGPRILRKRTYSFDKPTLEPPKRPPRIQPPATVPLPPMMAELSFSEIDVLQDEPERLPTLDTGEFKEDLD